MVDVAFERVVDIALEKVVGVALDRRGSPPVRFEGGESPLVHLDGLATRHPSLAHGRLSTKRS